MASAASPDAEAALGRFREFYEELYSLKELLRNSDWPALLGGRAASAALAEQTFHVVQTRLRRAIQGQAGGAAVAATGAPAQVDPGYVMAAVADEALLHGLDWPGLDLWTETPLELALYRSRIAGDRIFAAIDALLARRAPDPDGVAMIILAALQVGFRGRYYGADDGGEIAELKLRLFELVFRARAPAFREGGLLIAGAAEPLADSPPARLPPLRPWLRAAVGVVVGYLLLSWLVWWQQVSDVVAIATRVVEAGSP